MRRLGACLVSLLIVGMIAFNGASTDAQGDDPAGTIAAMQSTIDAQATKISQLRTQVARLKPEETPERDKRCLDVEQAYLDQLLVGLDNASGLLLNAGQAVKSEDYENVYFVAANLEGAGMDNGEIVVFATNALDASGLIMSINSTAQEFFVWPDGDSTDANITMDDDGADKAVECVKQALGE